MASVQATQHTQVDEVHAVAGIPLRNIWLLMLYSSDLFRVLGDASVAAEERPDEIPDLVAELLAHYVERRLRRHLSYGYRIRSAELSHVRGRIEHLRSERGRLLERGKIACRFDELTIDTPRNRYVLAALEKLAPLVGSSALANRLRTLASGFKRLGVSARMPTHAEISTHTFGRHDRQDQQMVAAAELAFQLALPTEARGTKTLSMPERDIVWLRRLFEKAMAGFYAVALKSQGWEVQPGKVLQWPIENRSDGINHILPSMRTDIVLEHAVASRRIVIDTKFTSLLKRGWYRDATIRSAYVYQIYAYLRSQEDTTDALSLSSEGLLLHPAVGQSIREAVDIQGHRIQFATVDLSASTTQIRGRLLELILTASITSNPVP